MGEHTIEPKHHKVTLYHATVAKTSVVVPLCKRKCLRQLMHTILHTDASIYDARNYQSVGSQLATSTNPTRRCCRTARDGDVYRMSVGVSVKPSVVVSSCKRIAHLFRTLAEASLSGGHVLSVSFAIVPVLAQYVFCRQAPSCAVSLESVIVSLR